ncbi:MAG TPA: hypothetical protein VNJ02_12595 [Vicinamibacterales bacterium]|nr:hypothetical protein [Vicinamibacterales bacterium]
MAKQKLFPEQPKPSDEDTREPHERFADFASRVINVSKDEVDKREQQWRAPKQRPKR